MKKIFRTIRNFIYNLFYGLSNADKLITQTGNTDETISINQQVVQNRVSQALLKGEVTQEVEELRYRTYKVDRESKNYEYFSPTLAKKRDETDSKFVQYENSDNLPIITIQPNKQKVETVIDALKNVNLETDSNKELNVNVGEFKQIKKYNINITRGNFIPRYKLEEYTKRLVVRKLKPIHKYVLDFYVSKYYDMSDIKSKGFVRETEKIMNEGLRSDITDIKTVNFVTEHAFNLDDMVEFTFKYLTFQKIIEYDGHYIFRYKATLKQQHDMLNDFYSKSMDEKYQKKAAKEVINNINGGDEYKKYQCVNCGKEIIYDTTEINDLPYKQARAIDEEISEDKLVTEYFDAQIAEQTTGHILCKECFNEWLKNNNIEKSNIYVK